MNRFVQTVRFTPELRTADEHDTGADRQFDPGDTYLDEGVEIDGVELLFAVSN